MTLRLLHSLLLRLRGGLVTTVTGEWAWASDAHGR